MTGLVDRVGASPGLRRLRILLAGPGRRRAPYDPKAEIDAALQAHWLIRAFYLVVLHFAFETQRSLQRLSLADREIDPLWPILWVEQVAPSVAAQAIGLGFLASAITAVVWTRPRWPRVLVALFYLQSLAFQNSFGSINHYGHFGLWLSIVFALMPGGSPAELRASRDLRRSRLDLFFLAQVLIATFYTSSGARKAYHGVVVPDGAASSFAPEALPLLVAQKVLQTGAQPPLADLIIQHVWLAWPAHLAVIYVELFALVAVFRPELHRLWGGLLMGFHLLVWLVLGISFAYQPVLLALLFVASPFAPSPRPPPGRLVARPPLIARLPLVGELLAGWRSRRSGAEGARQ